MYCLWTCFPCDFPMLWSSFLCSSCSNQWEQSDNWWRCCATHTDWNPVLSLFMYIYTYVVHLYTFDDSCTAWVVYKINICDEFGLAVKVFKVSAKVLCRTDRGSDVQWGSGLTVLTGALLKIKDIFFSMERWTYSETRIGGAWTSYSNKGKTVYEIQF